MVDDVRTERAISDAYQRRQRHRKGNRIGGSARLSTEPPGWRVQQHVVAIREPTDLAPPDRYICNYMRTGTRYM